MNIWIITTGSSDVKLKYNFDKNKWNSRYRKVQREQLLNHDFNPYRSQYPDKEESFTVPARVMGVVYGYDLDDETFKDLDFPLLNTFTQGFIGKNQPDKIIVFLTNQENVFLEVKERKNKKSPYWQDTCTLKPILEKYIEKNFPRLKNDEDIEYIEFKPDKKEQGLDNWNECLILVQEKIAALDKVNKLAKIYVSHQAGTPAISSAVQFASLSKFGNQVEFLLSNEYEKDNPIYIPSSNYLKGIKLQGAKALLERHDYSGAKAILANIWGEEALKVKEQKIHELLTMAIYWNCAQFEDFAKARGETVRERIQNWWWKGYEVAYLAVVRLEQGNTVEALFHSFRAVEGLIRERNADLTSHIPPGKFTPINKLIENIPKWESNPDIQIFKGNTIDERNSLFHSLSGLKEEQVFGAWRTPNKDKWKSRVLGCLNFVSGENLTSLKKASLMSEVDQELRETIDSY